MTLISLYDECSVCGAPPSLACTPECEDDITPPHLVRPHPLSRAVHVGYKTLTTKNDQFELTFFDANGEPITVPQVRTLTQPSTDSEGDLKCELCNGPWVEVLDQIHERAYKGRQLCQKCQHDLKTRAKAGK